MFKKIEKKYLRVCGIVGMASLCMHTPLKANNLTQTQLHATMSVITSYLLSDSTSVTLNASAGENQSVALGSEVTLDASNSTGSISYQWQLVTQPNTSTVSLNDTSLVQFNFTPDVIGTYIFELTVTSNSGISLVDSISITVWHNTGTLDTSFGGTGTGYVEGLGKGSTAIARDNEGNLYIAGSENSDMSLRKYKSDGSVAADFGTNGLVTYDNAEGGNDHGNDLVVDNEGNMYVTGYSTFSATDLDVAVWKFTPAGVLDTSFANNGVFTLDSVAEAGYNGRDRGEGIAIDKDNNIYVLGYSQTSTRNEDLIIIKLSADGVLDSGFSDDGIVALHDIAGGGRYDRGFAITLDSVGNVYVTGESDNVDNDLAMVILKYLPNGLPDTTFGSNGVVIYADSSIDYVGSVIKLDKDENIFVSGEGNDDMLIWKYNSSGVIVNNFGTNGTVVEGDLAGGSGTNRATSLDLDSAGNIHVAGYSRGSSDYEAVMLKYNSTGTRDSTFGTNGLIIRNDELGVAGNDFVRDAVLDEEGNWFVMGSGKNAVPETKLVIWKFQ